MNRKDWEGRAPSEFIGQITDNPPGTIFGGYVDAVDVILFDVLLADGGITRNVPRHAQGDGFPRLPDGACATANSTDATRS